MSFVCQNIYHDTLWTMQNKLPISLHRIDIKEIAETRFNNFYGNYLKFTGLLFLDQ